MGRRTDVRALLVLYVFGLGSTLAQGQQSAPVTVQPGAPGQPAKTLSEVTAAPPAKPPSEADVRFMQDMIMHHHQAVEMTYLAKTRSKDAQVREMAAKIDLSQTDEMRYMKQWLTDRGFPVDDPMSTMTPMDHSAMAGMDHDSMAGMDHGAMPGMDHSSMPGMDHSAMPGMDHSTASSAEKTDPMDVAMMPGMLTPRQMQTLRDSTGNRFDTLFLSSMIQHHAVAILMVKKLLDSPGAGQDPVLFDFANDVDNTQQAEIDIMKNILRKVNP